MCKHVLNAQVSIRAACCGRWYDCPLCHDAAEEHGWKLDKEVVFACKACEKAFRKDIQQFEESDEFCPHCANHFVVEAETPESIKQKETLALEAAAASSSSSPSSLSTLSKRKSRNGSKSSGEGHDEHTMIKVRCGSRTYMMSPCPHPSSGNLAVSPFPTFLDISLAEQH